MTKASAKRTLKIERRDGASDAQRLAEVIGGPTAASSVLTWQFGKTFIGEADLTEIVVVVGKMARDASKGDLSSLEKMLAGQAMALNLMFGELARRGALNMGEHMEATDRYLRLALKAQAQCRSTIEALATIKSPPVVFAQQANIAAGPQQVNNGVNSRGRALAHEENTGTALNKLMEADGGAGERLDGGATGAAIGGDPAMATVGPIDRAADS